MDCIDFGGSAHLIYEFGFKNLNILKGFGHCQLKKIERLHKNSVNGNISEGFGGSIANTLFWLNLLSHKVSMRGVVGNDHYGSLIKSYYSSFYNNEVVVINNSHSAQLVYNVDNDGNMLSLRYNYGVATQVDKLSPFPNGCRFVLVGGFELENVSTLKQQTSLICSRGKNVVLNLGGLKNIQKLNWFLRLSNNFKNLIIVGNIEETERLIKKNLDHPNCIQFITKGKQGASLIYKDLSINVDTTGINRVVIDTVGAGDGFLAMFLSQWLKSKLAFSSKKLNKILSQAVDFSSLITTYYGARPRNLIMELL